MDSIPLGVWDHCWSVVGWRWLLRGLQIRKPVGHSLFACRWCGVSIYIYSLRKKEESTLYYEYTNTRIHEYTLVASS